MEKDEKKADDSADYYGSGVRTQGVTRMSISESSMDNAIEGLVAQMRSTADYQNYKKQKETLRSYPELKERIEKLRELNCRMQNMPESESLYEEGEKLEQQYEELCEDTRVYDFMQAELDFCRMFQDILARITAGIEFE